MDTAISILFIILGLGFAGVGAAEIITRKIYFSEKQTSKSAPEAIRAAAPYMGVGMIVVGLVFIVSRLGDVIPALASLSEYRLYILLAGLVLCIPFIYLTTSKLGKK